MSAAAGNAESNSSQRVSDRGRQLLLLLSLLLFLRCSFPIVINFLLSAYACMCFCKWTFLAYVSILICLRVFVCCCSLFLLCALLSSATVNCRLYVLFNSLSTIYIYKRTLFCCLLCYVLLFLCASFLAFMIIFIFAL